MAGVLSRCVQSVSCHMSSNCPRTGFCNTNWSPSGARTPPSQSRSPLNGTCRLQSGLPLNQSTTPIFDLPIPHQDHFEPHPSLLPTQHSWHTLIAPSARGVDEPSSRRPSHSIKAGISPFFIFSHLGTPCRPWPVPAPASLVNNFLC